jgi:hypothetical protein
MQVIIYIQDNGIPAIMVPTPECLLERTIMEIALKDVPAGKPFKIVNVSDLPTNSPQEAWDVDEVDLNDGVGNVSNEFAPKPVEPPVLINEQTTEPQGEA